MVDNISKTWLLHFYHNKTMVNFRKGKTHYQNQMAKAYY